MSREGWLAERNWQALARTGKSLNYCEASTGAGARSFLFSGYTNLDGAILPNERTKVGLRRNGLFWLAVRSAPLSANEFEPRLAVFKHE